MALVERSAVPPHHARARQSECLGCADCRGLCLSLLELMRLPDLILKPRA